MVSLSDVQWRRSVTAEGRSFRWGRLGEDYVGEWAGILTVRADPSGALKALVPAPSVPERAFQKFVSGEAAAFLRSLRRHISLHASAVAFSERAVLFLGPSGAGKSTTASLLCRLFGARLLADDVAGLDTLDGVVRALPSEASVWLDNGEGGKAPVPVMHTAEATEVDAVVVLTFDETLEAPHLSRLRGASAMPHFLDALLRFDLGAELWAREFDSLARLTSRARLLRLARPHATPSDETARILALAFQRTGDEQ